MGLATTSTRARIRVEVARGASVSERWVTFTAEGKTHALLVDTRDVAGDLLAVTVVRDEGHHVVIELPRAAIAGKRVRVPSDSLLADVPPGRAGCVILAIVLIVVGGGGLLIVRMLE